MKLSLDQIRGVATGCIAANEEQGAVRFDRMPPAPAALYQREPASRVRLECPSGVRLRFRSRTRRLRLSLRYGAACRPHYKGALVVDQGDAVPFGPDAGDGPSLVPDEAAFFIDNVHPNAAGMQACAAHLHRAIHAAVPNLNPNEENKP